MCRLLLFPSPLHRGTKLKKRTSQAEILSVINSMREYSLLSESGFGAWSLKRNSQQNRKRRLSGRDPNQPNITLLGNPIHSIGDTGNILDGPFPSGEGYPYGELLPTGTGVF